MILLALWKPLNIEKKTVVSTLGFGVNNGTPSFNIDDNELEKCINMGSQDYPVISTRYGRTYLSTDMPTISIPNAIGERGNSALHIVDGNTWKYWNTATTNFVELTTALSSTDANITDFNTGSIRYSILMNGTDKKIWDGSSTATAFGDATTPNTKIFTAHKQRIFAAYNTTLYYSALNKPNDWTTSNDAGNIVIANAKGNITGLTVYNDRVIVFTEFSMHELYGDSPSNFTLVDIEGEIGCITNKSIIKCNKKLYWAWIDGIYEYNGASPIKSSKPVDKYFKGIPYANRGVIVCGSIGDFLYIAIPYNSTTNNMIIEFDTRIQRWFTHTGNFVGFVTIQNILYGITSDGKVCNMRDISTHTDNGSPIQWEFVTKSFHENAIAQKKVLTSMDLIYSCSTDATISVGYTTDINSTNFTTLVSSTDFQLNNEETNSKFLIPTTDLQNVDWYKFQIKGTGNVTIHALERNYRVRR